MNMVWKTADEAQRERIHAIVDAKMDAIINNPPQWAVDERGEWNPRGYDCWYVPQIAMIEHAVEANLIGHKRHAYEWEPDTYCGVYIDPDGDTCDGGCCDGMWKFRQPWKPYVEIPTYY